ncbi:Predicted kinase, aminoglycoside phosphotransferase (APT) family [Modestobacter sp. DSM 44400]|uniref:aminoglycoside phosphotransferase family protein n=1 Tax=Modestobacter sp. DSM 44400 TaxID=1550230 RepID=UPI0008976596|nr:aminoglycoside phosphotransferase family protein [Modestobacter sp. DSM 44400]SDY53039.1 Predicted kinase, aminoglycoside phosphotransferase (APT) family [Modestobacter sp. DSM 44400]
MHADEVLTDAALVRRLLAAQFPQWTGLEVTAVPSAGTDNALYRLGSDLAVRLPRIGWAVADVGKEQRWLLRLAPHLPLPVPVPLAQGAPGEGYPWAWSVVRWLDGAEAAADRVGDLGVLATDLAGFVTALHRVEVCDPAPALPPGRGVPLATRDDLTRSSIAALAGSVDTAAVTAAWEDALCAPAWDGAPVWVHGDLAPGNLLLTGGRLSAVIDFGALTIGDPAVDLLPAWNLFPAAAGRCRWRWSPCRTTGTPTQ